MDFNDSAMSRMFRNFRTPTAPTGYLPNKPFQFGHAGSGQDSWSPDDPLTLQLLTELIQKISLLGVNKNWEEVVEEFSSFVDLDNGKHIRESHCSARKFASACHSLAEQFVRRNQPMSGLALFIKAISKLQRYVEDSTVKNNVIVNTSCLTSVHADIAR